MITASVLGSSRLIGRLKMATAALPFRADGAVEIAANHVAEFARGFVAVDTGKTKANITVVKDGRSWLVVADRGGDGSAVPVFLEYGTRNMEARPFMAPAIDLVIGSNVVGAEVRAVGGLLKVK